MNTEHFFRGARSLLLGVFVAVAVARAAEKPVEIVQRLDGVRLHAMAAGDGVALGKLLSEEMIFIHSDARSEAKADYVKNMTAGDTAYADVKTTDVKARQIAADVIILTGAQEMKKKLGTEWSEIKLRFMSVWRNEAGTWRMVAWQSMRPSGNSVVPAKG